MTLTARAALSIAAGSGMWGLFWIPLRQLDTNGVTGLWAVALTLACAAVTAIPVTLWRARKLNRPARGSVAIGAGIGGACVLYFAGLVFSDVVRVIFLFYMLPVWATLISWFLNGERIGPIRFAAIGLALIGLWLLLGGDGGLPLPRNIGDVFGLAAGFLWALSLTLIRGSPDTDPVTNSAAPFVFGFPMAIALAIAVTLLFPATTPATPDLHTPGFDTPSLDTIVDQLPLALFFGAVLIWPSMLMQVWGAKHVPSPTAALLTMSEVLFAVTSAWLLIGTTLAPKSLFGGALIIIAAVIDLTAEHRAVEAN